MNILLVGDRFKNHIQESFLSENSDVEILDMLDLEIMTPKGYNLIIWENDNFVCPTKDKGCVLISVGNDNVGESLSDAFKMKANAVILIKGNIYELVDALGNLWCRTSDIVELLNNIFRLYNWNKKSIRVESVKSNSYVPYDTNLVPDLKKFCEIIRKVSDKVENERGGRYFGNASTRCSKMFPSVRSRYDWKKFQFVLVSKRNISKEKIQPDDFVVTSMGNSSETAGKILYYGDDKPSVDTPGQIELYYEFPKINFMIHGHAYISHEFLDWNLINFTEKYCSCGDLREISQIKRCVTHNDCDFFVVNLINHGFIIATDTIERMEQIVNDTNFIYRNIGEEIVKI